MDITKQLDSIIAQDEEGVVGIIYDKDDKPYLAPDGTPCTVTVVGSESKRVKNATREMQKKLGRRGKQVNVIEVMRAERAAAAIIEWHGWTNGDQPAPCTIENARALVRADHILMQVEGYRDERGADFFTSTSPS